MSATRELVEEHQLLDVPAGRDAACQVRLQRRQRTVQHAGKVRRGHSDGYVRLAADGVDVLGDAAPLLAEVHIVDVGAGLGVGDLQAVEPGRVCLHACGELGTDDDF